MDIKADPLFRELQMMAQQAGSGSPVESMAGSAVVSGSGAPDFADMLKEAMDNVNGLQSESNSLRTRFDLGDRSVDLGDVMLAANKASLAFDATVQVRNKLVEAYKEVMSMSV